MSATKQRTPRRPRSVVWYYFDKLPADPFKARCRLCGMNCQHASNTSNMFCHLRSKHPAAYEEAEAQREQDALLYNELKIKAGRPVTTPPTRGRGRGRPPGSSNLPRDQSAAVVVPGTLAVVKSEIDGLLGSEFTPQTLTVSHGRESLGVGVGRGKSAAVDLGNALLQWLATDMLHPSVMRKRGFLQFLSACGLQHTDVPQKKTISDTLLPRLAEEEKVRVRQDLEAAESAALTLESWTYRTTQSFLTLTAHIVRDDWTLASYVLETLDCTEDRTETNLATALKRVVDDWNLGQNILVLMSDVPDEVMSNAIVVNGWEELSCFGHALNRVVNEALASVAELERVHKKLSEASIYFCENLKASEALAAVQQQHNLPVNWLKQEQVGLWTSSYSMMERLLEQYEAVNTVLCFLGRDHMCLCDDEVDIIRDMLAILKPFVAAVEELRTEPYTCVSKLIPIASLLQQVTAASMSSEDPSTQAALKNALVSQMQQHFSGLESSSVLAAATLLDPRFKHHAFTDPEALQAAQERLLLDTQAVVKSSDSADSGASAENSASTSATSLWGMFDKKVVNAKALKTDVSEADNETQRFFKEVNIPRTSDPLHWWRLNKDQFPHLKVLARKFLCVPATAVDSGWLFSKEGIEFAKRRERFRPTHLNSLLFLNRNL